MKHISLFAFGVLNGFSTLGFLAAFLISIVIGIYYSPYGVLAATFIAGLYLFCSIVMRRKTDLILMLLAWIIILASTIFCAGWCLFSVTIDPIRSVIMIDASIILGIILETSE